MIAWHTLTQKLSLKTLRAKLFLAFAAVSATSIIVGYVGWLALANIQQHLDQVATHNLPASIATMELARQSDRLTSTALSLYGTTTPAEYENESMQLTLQTELVRQGLDRVKQEDAASATKLNEFIAKSDTAIGQLQKVTEERLQLRKKHTQLIAGLNRAHTNFSLVTSSALELLKKQNTMVVIKSTSAGSDPKDLVSTLLGVQMPAQQRLMEIGAAVNVVYGLLQRAGEESDPKALKALETDFQTNKEKLVSNLDELAKLDDIPELKDAATAIADYGEGANSIITMRRAEIDAGQRGLAVLANARQYGEALSQAVQQQVEAVGAKTASIQSEAERGYHIAVIAIALVVAAGLVGSAIFVLLYVGRRVVGRITGLNRNMTSLASGDLSVEIDGAELGDELADMAKAVAVFKQNAIDLREQHESSMERARQREERAERIGRAIVTFEQKAADGMGTLTRAANGLRDTSDGMADTAKQTSLEANTVAAAAEQASANVQAIASAAEELSASLQEISRQMTKSTEVSGHAVEEAEKTNALVRTLAETASRIGEVVHLIQNIAAQTNLLALNATIEAARAGEAGKGFAVVASEVKSLATQTAKATEEISSQIVAIQGATNEAVAAIGAIGGVIGEIRGISTSIASAVEEQTAATGAIAMNVQQTANGTTEVSATIANVSQAAGQTGEAAGRVQDAASELQQLADSLGREIEEFLADIRAA